jgi:hypothetical protein
MREAMRTAWESCDASAIASPEWTDSCNNVVNESCGKITDG